VQEVLKAYALAMKGQPPTVTVASKDTKMPYVQYSITGQ